MNKRLIRTAALAVSALALVCSAAFAEGHVWENGRAGVEMKAGEFKLLLSPELFKGSRADGYRAAWRRVAEIASGLGWKTEIDDDLTGRLEENVRIYSYPDTSDGALHAKFFTLRQRIPVKADGTLNAEKADLTLKYSAKDGGPVPAEEFLKGLPKGIEVSLKSGTLDNVKAYAGYVTNEQNETLCFCIISNNHTCSNADIKAKMEKMLRPIALYKSSSK